jgi:hypothetical protein
MNTPTWEQSVEQARLASLKTFEGRLEIARSSFEQIPQHGKGATHDYTVADFAEAIGMEYSTLLHYRSFAEWWGRDSAASGRISYTVGVEAQASGKWKSGKEFVTFIEKAELPTYTDPSGEYEPYTFTAWTMNALRVHLNRKPNNNLKLTLKERAGEEVTEDDVHVAAAKDSMETVGQEVGQIKSKKAKDETVKSVLDDALEIVDDEGTPKVKEDITRLLDEHDLVVRLVSAKDDLVALLEQAPGYLEKHGTETVRMTNAEGEEQTFTGADLVIETVEQVKGEVSFACDNVTGNIEAALGEMLAAGRS